MGVALDLVAAIVGHESGGKDTRTLVRHYVHSDMLERKAHALKTWDERLKAIGELAHETKFSIVTDEAPNQLTVRAELTGLPKFQAILSFIESQQRPQQAKVAD